MSVHSKIQVNQSENFQFTAKNFAEAQKIIAKYPPGRQQSAVMPLLSLAQQQHDGWLPRVAMDYVASILGMPPIKVYEVATFYTMYNLHPVGKHHLQVCTTTPCWLRGSDEVMAACESKLGVRPGETTADGLFTLSEVECLGACVNAPMVQVTSSTPYRDGFYEDLTPHVAMELIDALAAGKPPKFGSLAGRNSSEPSTGPTTLQKGKKLKPKFDAKITTPEDTGEPSPEALRLAAQHAAAGEHIEGRQPYSRQENNKRKEAEKSAVPNAGDHKKLAKKPRLTATNTEKAPTKAKMRAKNSDKAKSEVLAVKKTKKDK